MGMLGSALLVLLGLSLIVALMVHWWVHRPVQELVKEWEAQGGAPDVLTPSQREVLSDRLAFSIHGCQWGAPDRVARLKAQLLAINGSIMAEGADWHLASYTPQ